ncbi:MAG: 3-methyl-2-oxobutanoate hydroxymethyltransferase [Hyphomicrobiaceae bacterium]
MSSQPSAPSRRLTAPDIAARKGKAPIVSLTAYETLTAAIADKHCDFLLVGDSLAMVVHGYDSTLPISLDLMIAHGRAVTRGSRRALVVVDLPFGSYEESPQVAFRSAARVMREAECGAVKLEGGRLMADTIRYLVDRGIPVMAHIGLTPQAVNTLGGFKVQGRTEAQWDALVADARAVAEAGAFSIVLEAMPGELAARITAEVPVPTIGIGASAVCDGQILVMDDMLGMAERVPKFVKRYAEIGKAMDEAIAAYANEVHERKFPATEHTYAASTKPKS